MGFDLPSGPGKLVPRLIRDLLDYDPQRKRKNGKNLLVDSAPRYKTGSSPPLRRLEKDCQHNLYRKEEQTAIPRSDLKPEPGEFYKSASYCAKCLCHFDVSIDLSGSDEGILSDVCELDSKYPMHHLRCVSKKVRTVEEAALNPDLEARFDDWIEWHTWICSAPTCPAAVQVKIYAPRLDKARLRLLSDKDILYERGTAQIALDPDRYAVPQQAAPQTSADALAVLRQYLKDSLDGAGKRVAARNKKFQLCFSTDCDEIFEWLGFVAVEAAKNEDEPNNKERFWQLPSLPYADLTTLSKNNRHLVQDVYFELCQILSTMPQPKQWPYNALNSLRDLNAIFGITAYTARQRVVNLDFEEHPFYASLGVTGDFPDELVIFAYQRQRFCDPDNTAYYFECLKDIATGRSKDGGGEKLQMEVLTAESLGQDTQSDIDNAYEFFGLSSDASDETIIGNYTSRIESAPRQTDEAKKCLFTIGKVRQSKTITETATSQKMSPEDAARFLGIEGNPNPDVEDVQAAATVLLFDNDKEKVLQAVKAIAEAREDLAMNLYVQELETGRKSELSIGGAYSRLQCGPNMPDDTILSYYQQLSNGAPAGSKQSFLEALNVIAEHRQSTYLIEKVKHPNKETKGQPDQPVGIANIGNTCYLNSLLQYFYTVKAVRDVVMNFKNYKMPLNAETLAKKKVGGRKVKEHEILRAQEFVLLLANLYHQLKVAPTRAVKPTQELAEMTLYNAHQEEIFRRASMSGIEPSAMSIAAVMNSNEPFIGPQLPLDRVSESPPPHPSRPAPLPVKNGSDDMEMTDVPHESIEQDDAASDTTLVDQDATSMKDKDEEMSDATHTQVPAHLVLSNRKENESFISVAEISPDDAIEIDVDEKTPSPETPSLQSIEHKPPMPPRNKPAPIDTSGRSTKAQKLAFGAQQDVTEVIDNLMFYLQCAIKPSGYDPISGEQIDLIRDTFYGSNAIYLKKDGAMMDRKVEPWSNLIVFPDVDGSRSIYEALDVVFDEQVVEIDKATATQYASIEKLPPVLQIQVQRTAYDPVAHRATKNQNRIEFDETIYLDRYMDTSKVLQRRIESGKRKAELQQLNEQQRVIEEKENNLTKSDVLDGAKDFLRQIQEDDLDLCEDDLPDLLDGRRQELARRVEAIEKKRRILKAKIKEDFTDMRENRYRLQAVFVHRGGGIGSGHHYVYIYDFKNLVWREYNDERVEIVRDRKRVFESESFHDPSRNENPATAHYLVYVQDESLVDAVFRDMDDPAAEAPVEITRNQWNSSVNGNGSKNQSEHVEFAMDETMAQQIAGVGAGHGASNSWSLPAEPETFPVGDVANWIEAEQKEWEKSI